MLARAENNLLDTVSKIQKSISMNNTVEEFIEQLIQKHPWMDRLIKEHNIKYDNPLASAAVIFYVVAVLDDLASEDSLSSILTDDELITFIHDLEYNIEHQSDEIRDLIVSGFFDGMAKQCSLHLKVSPYFGKNLSYYDTKKDIGALFVEKLADKYLWLLPALQEHTTYHGQILSHVFFSDDIVRLLDEYSKSGRLTASDLELFTHDMEYNLANGEEKIQELIVVSFLESIEKQSQLYSRISPFFGEKLSYYHKLIWG